MRSDDADIIQYTLRFDGRRNHYVDVEGVFPAAGDSLELSMAVWTPGFYLIREYARHVEAVSAATLGGDPLEIRKVAKNRWVVASKGAPRVVIRYRLHAREYSVETNYVTDEIAILNGAPTFLRVADDKLRPFDVALEMPPDWQHGVTALDPHPDKTPHRYLVADYNTLVDSPIVLGNPVLHEFEVEGVSHVLANFGGAAAWDEDRSARDVETIVDAQTAFYGNIPYQRYVFLSVLLGSLSGLEHLDSTLIFGDRWMTRKRESYIEWLQLVSHEFFHTWNVRRVRPAALVTFDYERENYTRSLWVAEGLTSYYDGLFLRRSGLIDDKEFFAILSKYIDWVENSPGRRHQSLSDSSFDTWIKFYRRNENSRNSQLGYYYKGALVGFLVDAELRRLTGGRRSLDDVMRLAYERFSLDGYTPAQFRALAAEVAGAPLDELFARAVDSTDELDYGPALDFYGLRFAEPAKSKKTSAPRGDDREDDEEPGYLGLKADASGVVKTVTRDSPAFAAGINVGDELLAMDDYRIAAGGLLEHLERYRPDDKVEVLVARRDKLVSVEVTLGKAPEDRYRLEVAPNASAQARARRAGWLSATP